MIIIRAIGFLFVVIFSCAISIVALKQSFKFLRQGVEVNQGKVLSVSRGPVIDCLRISQTTQGESAIINACYFHDLDSSLEIGKTYRFKHTTSAWLFMDTLDVIDETP